MSKTPEQEKFEKDWKSDTNFAERMGRWDQDILDDSPDTYRKVPPRSQQGLFLDNMGIKMNNFANFGKRSADFQAEVDRKQRKQEEVMKEYDVVQFYKEMEETLKVTQKPNFPLPKDYKKIIKFWRWIFNKTNVKYKDFENSVRDYHKIQEKINNLNGDIETMRAYLAEVLEVELINKSGTPEEKKARADITNQQAQIHAHINDVTQLKVQQTEMQEFKLDVWNAVERELREESIKIKKKFGARVASLFFNRQALISELRNLNVDQPEQLKKKYEIHERINNIDIELKKIKMELVEYKAKRPIFLFERIFGVVSIPEIYRYGQESSEELTKIWKKSTTP